MEIEAILEEYELAKTPLFRGFLERSIEQMLECLAPDVLHFQAGDPILWEEKNCAMLLRGRLAAQTVTGETVSLTEGTNLGAEFYLQKGTTWFREYRAKTPVSLLTYDRQTALNPCWFSCFYHAAFLNNLLALVATQNEALGLLPEYSPEAESIRLRLRGE